MKTYSIVNYLDAKDVEASGFSAMVILFLLTCARFKFYALSFLFDRKTPRLTASIKRGVYERRLEECSRVRDELGGASVSNVSQLLRELERVEVPDPGSEVGVKGIEDVVQISDHNYSLMWVSRTSVPFVGTK